MFGCWIYNYLWNQSLSPLLLWVRILLRRGVLDTTFCDEVFPRLATGRWFFRVLWFPPPIKHSHDITEILLKVALNTITLSLSKIKFSPNPKNVCVERMEGVNGISGWSRVLYVYRFTFIVELNWFIYIICINKNLGNVIEYRNKHYQLYIFIFVIILFCL